MKRKIISIFAAFILATIWHINTPVANAGYNQVSRNACSLAVFPFNIASQRLLGNAGTPFINKIDEVCDNFVNYPNAYAPQPPSLNDNPVKADAEDKNVPITKHIHAYFNDSVEDNYYYMAFMDRFEITIEQDGFNSIKLDEITCGTPIVEGFDAAQLAPINDCDGTVNNLWGGTTVSKQRSGNNFIVTWDFAQTANNQGAFVGRPIVWGNNGANFDGMDLRNENNRKLQFYVNLESKDNDRIWSATTTSRALIAHRGIKKTNYPENQNNICANDNINNGESGWCYLETPGNFPEEVVRTSSDKTYHWFPIGSVSTVWVEPAPIPNECIGMNLTRAANPVTIEGRDGYKLTVNNINFDPGEVPAEAMLQWEAPSSGKFYRRNVNGTFTELDTFDIAGRGQLLRINRNTDIFYVNTSGENNQRVTVTLVEGENGEAYSAACKKSVEVPPQDFNVCSSLEAGEAQPLSREEVIRLTGNASNWPMYKINLTRLQFEENDIPNGLNIRWESVDPNGSFWRMNNNALVNTLRNPVDIGRQENVVANEIYYHGNGPVTVKLSNIAANLDSPGCADTIQIAPPQNVCSQLTAALQHQPITINGRNAYPIMVSSIFFQPQNVIPANATLVWTSEDPEGEFWQDTVLFEANPDGSDLQSYLRIGIGSATTRNNERKVYYIGDGPVSVTLGNIPANQIGAACQADFELPQQECKEIQVNRPARIIEGTFSRFIAQAIDTNNTNMTNQISYSVDLGHGRFSLNEPQNVPENPSAMIREFGFQGRINQNVGSLVANRMTPLERVMALLGEDSILNRAEAFASVVIDLAAGGEHQGAWPIDEPANPNPNPNVELFNSVIGFDNLVQNDFSVNANWIRDFSADLREAAINVANIRAPLTVAPGTEVFFTAREAGEQVVHVDTVGTNVAACGQDFDIEEVPEEVVCENLNFTRSFEGDVPAGQRVIINIDPVDQNGNPLPPETRVLLSSTAGGSFQGMGIVPEEFEGSAEVRDFPMLFIGSNQAGTVTVQIDPEDPAFEAGCRAEFAVIEQPEELVCTDLRYVLKEVTAATGATQIVNQLEKNKVYIITGDSIFNGQMDEDIISYSMDPNYGTIIRTENPGAMAVIIKILQQGEALERVTLQRIINQANLINNFRTFGRRSVLIVTYNSAPASINNALRLETEGTNVAACKKEIPLVIPPPPPEVCQQIILATADGTLFNPNAEFTNFRLTGDFKNHDGNIEITISGSGKGTINKPGGPDEAEKIFFTPAEVAASNNLLGFTYKRATNFDPTEDFVEISVRAAGAQALACSSKLITVPEEKPIVCENLEITNPRRPWRISEEDSEDEDIEQLFQIDVSSPNEDELYYNWSTTEGKWESENDDFVSDKGDQSQVLTKFNGEEPRVEVWASELPNGPKFKDANGNEICIDDIKLEIEKEEEKKPPEIEKFAYKNYKLRDAADVININESVNNVGFLSIMKIGEGSRSLKIKDSGLRNGIVKGSIDGRLVFEEMIIHVIEDDKEYTIYRTSDYKDEIANNKFAEYSDNKFTNFKERMSFYEDKYSCEEDNNDRKFCIDITDFAGIADEFKKGNDIAFKNLNKLDPDSRIVIKYQTKYPEASRLDNEACEDLRASTGCGEKFKNTIEFQSYEDNEYRDELFDDEDSATVIAICPYVLTRQGGDVFFHDLIDTGIDVSKCAEVKSCEGVCITPPPPEDIDVPKTGMGEFDPLEDATLTLDSENVCKYSNLEGNIEGYNDVLKNFSSTLCEFRAEVGEAWKLKNINEAINAGITRIARFESFNSSTGVTYSNANDLNIGNANMEKTIQKEADKPAAQTYITRNANINIWNNIKYGETDFTKATNQIPSAAFIAINGNINIKNEDINQLDGVFIAIDLDPQDENDVGKITQERDSLTQCLTINGNLIGDVNELFKRRKCAGDYQTEASSVTIRYSSRILLNTPPGLKELLNVQQALVP